MKGVTFYSFCYHNYYIVCLMVIILVNESHQHLHGISTQIANTITVDLNGEGNYKTVQSAIDSIPLQNQNWIRILIKEGVYIENVTIPIGKGYIYLQGAGIEKTTIAYDDHQLTNTSSTFTSYPDNIIISGITFKNTYNIGLITSSNRPIKPAGCTLNLTLGIYAPERMYGTITAQGRESPEDNGGFVFKGCTITGNGKTLLGRAWKPYARVIFYSSTFSDVVLPIGWDAWTAKGQESHTTFVEYGCSGSGADTSQRVPWMKKASAINIVSFTDISFINQEGWINKLPMERRVGNAFPGQPPPPVPYYHNNNNYNPHHHQIHPPHHHIAAVGFHQYPQNDNRDQRFNQPHFDNHYPAQQQQQQHNMIVDAPPFPPTSGFSPSPVSLRKRRSLSSTPDPSAADGSIAKLYVAPVPKTATEEDVRQVFEKYGNVTEIILPKDKNTCERAAYCFVKYKKLEEGSAAIAALTDQYTFPGEMAPVKVRYADAERERGCQQLKLQRNSMLDASTNKQQKWMSMRYGIIEDIYMALDDMKISRGYAFVQFLRREMALAAIKGLNGVFTMRGSDQPLTVRFADPKKPRLGEPRSNFNAPPAMQQFDQNWHPQPYPQWGNNEPRAAQHHDFASQPNHFPQQNAQAASEVHQDTPPQNSETAIAETRGDGQKISSQSNAFPEDQNTVSPECDWSEHTCPDGNKYYFHCVTCESTWEKPEEYSMFERWFDEQTRQQDDKLVSPPLNNQSQGEIEENSEQLQSHPMQQTTKLQQPSLSTADEEKNLVYPLTSSGLGAFGK
ncbi:unnamed protein product, partial [Thlaspi arvense]